MIAHRPNVLYGARTRPSRWGWPLFRLVILLLVVGSNLYILLQGKYPDLLSIDVVIASWALIVSKRNILRLSPVIMYAFLFTVSLYAGNVLVYLGYVPQSESVFDPRLWDTSLALLAFCCGAYFVSVIRKASDKRACNKVQLNTQQLRYLYAMYALVLLILIGIIYRYGLPSIEDVESRIAYTGHLGYASLFLTCFLPLFATALIAILAARNYRKKAALVYLLYMVPFVLFRMTGQFVFLSILPLMVFLRLNVGFSIGPKQLGIYIKIGAACITLLVAALFLRVVAYGRTDKVASLTFVAYEFVGRVVISEAGAFSAIAKGGWSWGDVSSYLLGLLPFAPNSGADLMHSLAISTRAGPVGIRHWGTLPPTLIGDLYMIGGRFTMLAGSFLFGILLRLVDIVIDRKVRNLSGLIIMCYFAIVCSKMCLTGLTLGAREAWRVLTVWFLFIYIPTLIAKATPYRAGVRMAPQLSVDVLRRK